MKLCLIGQFPPHVGGVGVHIRSLADSLIRRGDEVFVLTYPHKDVKDIGQIHVESTINPDIKGLRSLFFTITGTIKLIKIINRENIDIVHGHYLFPAGLVAVLAGKFKKKPVYVTAHGSDVFCLYKRNKFMRPVIKYVLKHADKVLVVSEALKKELLNINIEGLADKVEINWNVVDIDRFQKKEEKSFKKELSIDKPIVMFVGNLIPRKKVKYLLEAKKLLKNDCYLIIVGDGPLMKDLKETTKDLDLKNVIFTGARYDVEEIIPSADILVLPSVSESFGLVLIEALACGVAVIGSNVDGIREIVTDDVGLLVEPKNSEDLAKAIDNLLSNEELLNSMKANARDRAIEFSEIKIPY